MKRIVITLFTLSICLASGNIQKQMDDLMKSLQDKYQISGPEDLYKLKTQQTPQHGRTASRDMEDLVGDWMMEEQNMEFFITVGSDQSIPDYMTLMAMVEADGSITATASDYVAELKYLLDSSIMEGGDGGGDCDISCEDEYNDYNDYGMEPSDIYCECCHEDWPLEDICEDDGGGDGGGVEFQYGSVADLYADYGSVLESMGTGCDGCTGNLEEMDAVTSFDIAVQSEFENWANNYAFIYYFQFIDENENDTYDGGEIYAVSCEWDDINMTVAYDGSVYELSYEIFWMDAYDFYWSDDDDPREDTSRNYDALTFAKDYVNDNSSDWGENAFDLESEFSLVVDGDYVSGGLGGDDPGNCEINWPEDPYKMAVYSFVSEYVLVEGGSVGCFLDDTDLDQTYANFVMGMENEWAGGGGDDEPIFFEKEDYADVSDPANWDQITESVAITRADNQGLFNPYSESSYNELGEYGPAGTLWAPMSTEEATMLDTNVYTSWHAAMNNNPQSFIDETVSLWCLEEDKYYDIVMASWTNGNNGGGFSYWRYPADASEEFDDGPDLLIMNMDLMEFFMVSFGMDLDSLDIENPTVIGFGSSSDDENMVMGIMFDETGVIELMADSEEAAAATSLDETSITFTNLSLYDSTGAAVLTVTGTIGPGMIDLEAGVETPIDFFNEDGEGDDDMEFYVSFSEDSTGMDIEVEYDDYYGEEYSDTSYFDWSATTDSLFLYFEDDDYYYEDGADTMALGYMIIEDTLFASASFNPCEDDGYESYEECFSDMGLPGFDELVDVESFRINQETVFTSTVLTSIEPTNEGLPEEFKLYAAYPNPFNPVTTIRFDVGSTSHESTLRIYDVSGRNVATLISGQLQPGSYEVQWDARGFASGIYFSELISGTKRHTQKMVLLK